MDVKDAYNMWAQQYDTNLNKTRDLEAFALREILKDISFNSCLEIGCGTGKNTEWLLTRAEKITAVDLSEAMLAKARLKINSDKVKFYQADIHDSWKFADGLFDLITFSLVLEHIENLDLVFKNAFQSMARSGYMYVGELHPFKQYSGTKARFENETGSQIVTCFNHNISDFIQSAQKNGFQVENINEYFDGNDRNTLPRILTILFKKAA